MADITREEQYLDAIANGGADVPEPVTRVEQYWYQIVQNSSESLPDGDNLAY